MVGHKTGEQTRIYDRNNDALDSDEVAIKSTFMRRETDIPSERPTGFSNAFSQDPIRQTQWAAYSAETDVADMTLEQICDDIWAHLEPVCAKAK